ncbi:YggS family pyridoxal phosphate-dependent enzyme [Haloimpatiens sp. FM7315]|uniref:YggS family pyridoxal phosphate-dependent enzyme n=1 Tax=Haloimpatiens sp. FM7315 TaxID=3298609 RepID=UPI00370B6740
MSIKDNIQKILPKINKDVTLIAVSKTRSVEEMEIAYREGLRDFGENKVQELVNKSEEFHKDVRWHLIGHLQTNKVKYIVGKVHLIQSLDSEKLLHEIEKRYSQKNLIANVLIEVNIGKEESKSGIDLVDLDSLLEKCETCKNVRVKGLMCIIPKGSDKENRAYFKKMKIIFENLKTKKFNNVSMDILSMGMSGDYELALEEGSNMVRIGQGIFGPRNYEREVK